MQQKRRRRAAAAAAPADVAAEERRRADGLHLRAVAGAHPRACCSQQLVEAQILRALLESNAAFYAAQMTAMDAATRNSADMIESLTLYMNKIRQAAITREIIEVVSGAQAL